METNKPHPAADVLAELRRATAAIRVTGHDGVKEVIRRESVLDLIDQRIAALPASNRADGERLPAYLEDRETVHAMMMRGDIAVPSVRDMVHLRGEVFNTSDTRLARIAELQEQVAELRQAAITSSVSPQMADARACTPTMQGQPAAPVDVSKLLRDVRSTYIGRERPVGDGCDAETWDRIEAALARRSPAEGEVPPFTITIGACAISGPRPDVLHIAKIIGEPEETAPPAQPAELAAEYTRGRCDGWEAAKPAERVPEGYALVPAEAGDTDAFMVLHEYQQPGRTRKDAYRIAIRKLSERARAHLAASPATPAEEGDGKEGVR